MQLDQPLNFIVGWGHYLVQHSSRLVIDYILTRTIIQWDLSRPPQQRQAVNYRPELLISYQPNESYLLT